MGCLGSAEVRQLLHNKFVVIMGDSIQRSVYKDLVKLLQTDQYLSEKQLKKKGEFSFENDTLVEGGLLNEMHNGTTFREVRQYRTGFHLVRFYFLTRAYSTYLESVLADFQSGPQPDVLIISSCIWDVRRYGDTRLEAYKTNLYNLFHRLTQVLRPECLVIWNMTMPVGFKAEEMPENTTINVRGDVMAGNFYSATLADFYKMDVLDMHYHFRFDLRSRCGDATHWNQLAHRKYSQILLTHIAQAWGVEVPESNRAEGGPYIPGHIGLDGDNFAAEMFLPEYFNFENDNIQANGHNIAAVPHPRKHHCPPIQPSDQERDRSHNGAPYIPGYAGFDGGNVAAGQNIAAVPHPRNHHCPPIQPSDQERQRSRNERFLPGYFSFENNYVQGNAAPSFVDDSPVLVRNVTPGYCSAGGNRTAVSVPIYKNYPFSGMGMLPQRHGVLPDRVPLEPWNGHHRLKMKRPSRQQEERSHPFYQPPSFPHRIL
ncbi:PC-esterase domain-containing protein 1A-like isoform X4 [Pseudophryne corroboree]|uniref:PC-esterase domain-containing protein 1A-like isoform X4 n=1 Tax=Pseudophryne corroboree TaxID=495146 RepID=UPI00308167B9